MTRRVYAPHAYQPAIREHILDAPRGAVWARMGAGKTVETLTALDARAFTYSRPTLIVAPRRVVASVWSQECAKWEHLSGFEVVPVLGPPAQRAAALKLDRPAYAINYENLAWLRLVPDRLRPDFGTIVADESTKLKGFRTRQGTVRAAALAKLAERADYFVELTGTPAPNGLIDLWGQAFFLDGGARLGKTFTAFVERWFQCLPGGDGYVQWRPLPHAHAEISERLRDLCITIDPRPYLGVGEPVVMDIFVDLPPKAKAIYRKMERELFVELDGRTAEAFNAAGKSSKCLQLANGAVYVDPLAGEDGKPWREVHDAKIEALESVINEAAGMPVLVAYQWKSDLARLLKAFPYGRALDKDPATVEQWNAGRIPVLFAHPQSAGHGLNLADGGNILAVFGHWWNLEEYEQIVERIGPTRQAQAGHKRPTLIYHIYARDTVDEDVAARRTSKRDVQELLLEGMKRRGHK